MHVHTSKEFLNAMAVEIQNSGVLMGPKTAAARQYPLESVNNYHALHTSFDKISTSRLTVLCMYGCIEIIIRER
jgi:hypothetical protein